MRPLILDIDFGPLGRGEEVLRQYLVDNTRPPFKFKKFLKGLLLFGLPSIIYLVDVFTSRRSARIVLTNRRLAYEEVSKSIKGTRRGVICVDVSEVSLLSFRAFKVKERRGFLAKLFRRKAKVRIFSEWKVGSPYFTLMEGEGFLTMGSKDSGSDPEDAIRELGRAVYELRERTA